MRAGSWSGRVRACCGVLASVILMCGWAAPVAEASLARSLGQPISAYSASLFGKKNLTAQQKQTLTADPDEPLGGSTSVTFDPTIVRVTGFGFGPGYLRADSSPFSSGVGIEVVRPQSPTGFALIDLNGYLEQPSAFTPTGYLRAVFRISGEGVSKTGKLTDDVGFQESHVDYLSLDNDGPLGVDTHYFDFEYLGNDDAVAAPYSVFADTSTSRYAFTPNGNSTYTLLATDYVITQDAPNTQIHPGGSVPFVGASVSGTVPEPASVVAALGGLLAAGMARRRPGARLRR